jgi:hypothetical protein
MKGVAIYLNAGASDFALDLPHSDACHEEMLCAVQAVRCAIIASRRSLRQRRIRRGRERESKTPIVDNFYANRHHARLFPLSVFARAPQENRVPSILCSYKHN